MIKIIFLTVVLLFTKVHSSEFNVEYNVSTAGIKIGKFTWDLEIDGDKYITEINLKNSGFFSPLYKFNGQYFSKGTIKDNKFRSIEYQQYWKTKKKIKTVEMVFDAYPVKLVQKPIESEHSRVDLESLFDYFDPITSFINILNGSNEVKTIDGRRIYVMKKSILEDTKKISLQINDYKNIWADHKRNDLKSLEFLLDEENFLPSQINIHFKERVFKLKKI